MAAALNGAVGAALLGLLVFAGIARVLYPSLRRNRVRRELAVVDAKVSAASEWAAQQAAASVEGISSDLESGAITVDEALARDAAEFGGLQQAQQAMHAVHLRRAELRGEFWRLAPRRELAAEIRRLESLAAGPALPGSGFGTEMELQQLRAMRGSRELELPGWLAGVLVASFVAMVIYRFGGFA